MSTRLSQTDVYHDPVRSPRLPVRRLFAPFVALSLLPVGLSACSGSSTSTTTTVKTTTSTTTSAVRTLCTAVRPAQIHVTTGLEVLPATVTSTKTTVNCNYKGSDPAKSVIILYEVDVTPTDFTNQAKAANSAHGPITHVSDLGDAAYYFMVPSKDTTITTLALIHGQAEIVITSTATVAQITTLAKVILSYFSSNS